MKPKPPQEPEGPKLTPREKETLELLLRGLSDKLIADELRVSYGAVRRHVDSLLRKYGAHSRLELAAAFLQRSSFTA